MSIQLRYEKIKESIEKLKTIKKPPFSELPSHHLIAVSKQQSIKNILKLYHLGQRDFGENYAQELSKKADILKNEGFSDIRWHFIGNLQSNKIKSILPFIHSIHSITTLTLANKLHQECLALKRVYPLPIFIQINIDDDPHKKGVLPENILVFVTYIKNLPLLQLQGLMCIAAQKKDPRKSFKRLNELEKQCRPESQGMLSMGMSEDYEIAIQEGATHIRIGTALFGQRESFFVTFPFSTAEKK